MIDYKTGSAPSHADVKSGLASQLPLYAMAVERLVMPAGDATFLDAGYWSLPKDGFRGVKLGGWDDYRAAMVEFVLALVGELRRGVFPSSRRTRVRAAVRLRTDLPRPRGPLGPQGLERPPQPGDPPAMSAAGQPR